MKTILKESRSQKIRRGKFNIDIVFPGLELKSLADPRGFAQLGRFDRAFLHPGVFVAMHPHQNDEIFTYMREGNMVHEDSEGKKEILSKNRMMLMNAGSGIYHQESVPDDGAHVRLLQVFIRPEKENITPAVQFADFEEAYSINQWRLLAGTNDSSAPLKIQSEVNVYDARLVKSSIPLKSKKDKSYVLYVFDGEVEVNAEQLWSGDTLVYNEKELNVSSNSEADLVLFELNEHAQYTRNGMYSGT